LILPQTSTRHDRPAARNPITLAGIGHRDLEARLQLSGSPFVFNATAPSDLTVRVQGQGSDAFVQLLDAGGNVVSSQPLASTSDVQVIGSHGDDRLTVAAGAINALPISFAGGAGSDTLAGPGLDLTWNVTAVDAGKVGKAAFTAVENLLGAAGNRDNFVFAANAGLSGVVAGGDAGFDTVVLNGKYDAVGYEVSGRTSGAIRLDGQAVTFDGMEPVKFTEDPGTFTYKGTAGADTINIHQVVVGDGSVQMEISGTGLDRQGREGPGRGRRQGVGHRQHR
jgi:hypothetical protein